MVKASNQGLDDTSCGVGIASVSFDHVFETRFSTRFPRLVSVYEEVMAKNKDTNHYECDQPER